jgi:hypothetical protein
MLKDAKMGIHHLMLLGPRRDWLNRFGVVNGGDRQDK